MDGIFGIGEILNFSCLPMDLKFNFFKYEFGDFVGALFDKQFNSIEELAFEVLISISFFVNVKMVMLEMRDNVAGNPCLRTNHCGTLWTILSVRNSQNSQECSWN